MNTSARIAVWVSLLSLGMMFCLAAGHDAKGAAFFGLFASGAAIVFKKEAMKP